VAGADGQDQNQLHDRKDRSKTWPQASHMGSRVNGGQPDAADRDQPGQPQRDSERQPSSYAGGAKRKDEGEG
jgi:hypothetical protein